MQFQFSQRREYVSYIEFFNTNPIASVQKIRYFKEMNLSGSFTSKQFKYSFNNSTWSSWITLTEGNLAALQTRDQDLYMVIRYNRQFVNDGNISTCYLIYDSTTSSTPDTSSDNVFMGVMMNTSDEDWYNTFIGTYAIPRVATVYEDSRFKYIDVVQPYYKINPVDASIALRASALATKVGLLFTYDASLSGGGRIGVKMGDSQKVIVGGDQNIGATLICTSIDQYGNCSWEVSYLSANVIKEDI